MADYIDVRGVWPVYIHGLVAVTLVGYPRSVTVEQARNIVKPLLS